MGRRFDALLPYVCITLFCIAAVEGGRFLAIQYLGASPARVQGTALTVAKKVAPPAAAQRTVREKAEIILKRNLFGGKPAQPEAADDRKIALEGLQATSLALVLMGTTLSDAAGNIAVILDKTENTQDIYRVGDAVAGAVVTRILRGKVVLDVEGRNEVLDMLEAATYADRAPVAAASSARAPQTVVAPTRPEAAAGPEQQSAGPAVVPPSPEDQAEPAEAPPEPGAGEDAAAEGADTPPEPLEQAGQPQPGEEIPGQPQAVRSQRKFSFPPVEPAGK